MPKPQLPQGAPPEVVAAYNTLSQKQQALALALPTSATVEAAMLAAGYAASTARKKAGTAEADGHPSVRMVVNWLVSQALAGAQDSVERVIEELCRMALLDPRGMFDAKGCLLPVNEWPEELARCVASVDVFEEYERQGKEKVFVGYTRKVRFQPKTEAASLLAKIKGWAQPEKHQHEHRVVGLAGLLKEIDGADTGPGPARSRRG